MRGVFSLLMSILIVLKGVDRVNGPVFMADAQVINIVLPPSNGQLLNWGLASIMAPYVWTLTKGEGVKVAILDTGVDFNHPDLKPNIIEYTNFTSSTSALDRQGHGTHCAGIVGATDNGSGVVGVAPSVQLYCAKVLDDSGYGDFDVTIKGIQWAIDKKVDIISMSLGSKVEPPQEYHTAIKQAKEAGIIIVAAAGNDHAEVSWPARYDETISVAAMDEKFDPAFYSNFGVANTVIAPGSDILSTYKDGGYAILSGTSMATPMMAGAVALYISYQRKLGNQPTFDSVYQALMKGTVDLGDRGKDQFYGYGLINMVKMLS